MPHGSKRGQLNNHLSSFTVSFEQWTYHQIFILLFFTVDDIVHEKIWQMGSICKSIWWDISFWYHPLIMIGEDWGALLYLPSFYKITSSIQHCHNLNCQVNMWSTATSASCPTTPSLTWPSQDHSVSLQVKHHLLQQSNKISKSWSKIFLVLQLWRVFAVGRSIVRRLLSETVKWSVLRSCSFLVSFGSYCQILAISVVALHFPRWIMLSTSWTARRWSLTDRGTFSRWLLI